ncbi:hypothetical protein BGZ72_007591 [Mortierella alpina]|nr:hypothetical protein BGZ72_007591 [Mortierella alpina]
MIEHGRVVVNCTTEADLAIAQACLPTDIVLSRDSDMLYYASIRTIWRPISKGRVLVYDIKEVMATLGLNQAQFTVLGMVSRNDYNRNIDDNISASENYITLNNSTKSLRRTLLLTGIEQHFITFSELELILLLWQNEAVNQKMQKLALKTLRIRRSGSPNPTYYTGFRKNRQKAPRSGRRDYRDKTSLMSLEEMRWHLQRVRDPDFDSRTYTTTGYALRGSIRTDGFRVQALAFKLTRPITSTLGGLVYYLTEIRNVIKTSQDMGDIFDSPQRSRMLSSSWERNPVMTRWNEGIKVSTGDRKKVGVK